MVKIVSMLTTGSCPYRRYEFVVKIELPGQGNKCGDDKNRVNKAALVAPGGADEAVG